MRSRRLAALLFIAFTIVSFGIFLHGEVPDVPTGQWLPGPALAQPRAGAVSVALDDGRVLVIGGRTADGPVNTVDVFGTDGSLSVGAPLLEARAGHAAAKLPDGRVLVVGGTTLVTTVTDDTPVTSQAATASAEIFDPLANAWFPVGSLSVARSGATATAVLDGHVVVAGGAGQDGAALDSFEVFDAEIGAFASTGLLSAARSEHAAALAGPTKVLVGGGRNADAVLATADIVDVANGSVTAVVLNTARAGATATTLLDGKILLAGGSDGVSELASTEIVDPVSGVSAGSASMAQARRDHVALLLDHNNTVLIVGGTSAKNVVASAEQFVPWTGEFLAAAPPTAARASAAGSNVGKHGVAWLAAGRTADALLAADSELYGFATLKTDKDDYSPGTTVVASGSGWQPGEDVTLILHEVGTGHSDRTYHAIADSAGSIVNTNFVPDAAHVGVRFYLTARGVASWAQVTFTDGNKITFSTSAAGAAVTDFGTVTPGQCVQAFVQERQGANLDVGAHAARLVSLTSTSAGATFHTNSGCGGGPNQVTSVTIPLNTSSVPFFFKVATAGSYTLNGDGGLGGSNASAVVTVQTPGPTKLAFTTSAFTGAVGQCLGPISIQTQNASNTATNVTSNTLVSLGSDGAGQFYASGDGACSGSVITGVTIASGTNAASFRYKATTRGTGSHSLTVSAASLTSASQIQTIAKANQTITFGALANKTYGDPDFTVSATASSALAVTFAASGNCTVTGNNVHITGAGSCTITASQPGDTNYNAAPNVDQSFTVARAATITTVTFEVGPYVYRGSAFTATAAVTGAGGLSQSVAAVSSGDCVNVTAANGCTATATFAGDDNHDGSTDSKSITITPATAAVNVTGFTGPYDGAAHGASGTATGVGGVNLSALLNLGASFTTVPGGTANWTFNAGSANPNYGSTSGTAAIVITKASSTTTLACPSTVTYTGLAQTPCTGSVAGIGGLNQAVSVTYLQNTNPGTATANASYSGDTNHQGSSDTKTFAIAYGLCSPAVGAGGVILQPINSDGTSVFARKGGSTIPVKFRVCDAAGNPISNPAAVFAGTGGSLTMLGAVRGTIDVVNEPGVSDIPDAGFRYSDGQWIFNMATSNLAQGTTYTFGINLASGTNILFRVGVK